ncbi:MAG: hypothetical protein KGH54_01925 [Candidatus Micrarchaeota archaeon]|nr:hypothetical protein [Candidatus Micrarchaeota archaeon]
MNDIKEVDLEEAKKMIEASGKKFVWIGGPTRVAIPEILDVSDTQVLAIEGSEIRMFRDDKLKVLKDCVIVCPHGRTSLAVAKFLKGKNIEAYSLKGGVAAIIGENY